ncbi:MAG: alpha/beta hydrolase [Actinomycetota bacterium]
MTSFEDVRRFVARWPAIVVLAAVIGGAIAWRALHPGTHPERFGVKVVHFAVHSKLVGRTLTQVGVEPPPLPGGARRPLLVFLHGRGGSPDGMLSDQLYAALRAAGDDAPDVVAADGDDASYFHDRRTGKWGTYVVSEVIPQAARVLHADPRRVAIGGVSMGGFGALDIARLHPRRFCAVGGHSAAMWETGGQTPEGAFDDAEDFARHDVIGSARRSNPYGPTPVWLDVGDGDPFLHADTLFASELRRRGADVTFHVWPGGHGTSYWWSHIDEYVRFYASALARC